jgi:uncharacterized membrane protein YdjX (TVP38/TMEM64 family)
MIGALFSSKEDKRKAIITIIALIAALFLISYLAKPWWSTLMDKDAVREYILSYGPYAPVVFVFLQIAQVLIAPIPGQVMGFAGGFVFGWKLGIVYSTIGLACGTFIALALSRKFGRPFVEKVVDRRTLKKFDHLGASKGPFALFMIFLLPFFPDDAICFIAGLTAIPIARLMFIAIVGRFPWMLMLSLVGDGFAKEQIFLPILLISIVIGASALAWVYRREIEERYHSKNV